MTDDEIRLFNELMSTQPGEQIEGSSVSVS
jgi:hypothetical protein